VITLENGGSNQGGEKRLLPSPALFGEGKGTSYSCLKREERFFSQWVNGRGGKTCFDYQPTGEYNLIRMNAFEDGNQSEGNVLLFQI